MGPAQPSPLREMFAAFAPRNPIFTDAALSWWSHPEASLLGPLPMAGAVTAIRAAPRAPVTAMSYSLV